MVLENDGMTEGAAERRRFTDIVRRNLERARGIIDDIRELALARSTYAGMGRRERLADVLAQALAEVEALARERGVEVEVPGEVPDMVVDASRVEIILLNLIGNAIKYSDPGKPHRWIRLRFTGRAEDGERWVSVADNGLGIPPEHQGSVFQRFFRAHPAVADGTGLGLSIAREAAEQIGSRLVLESHPGEGTTFRFSLPRLTEDTEDTVGGADG
jgi:signal transduction histidine kinase